MSNPEHRGLAPQLGIHLRQRAQMGDTVAELRPLDGAHLMRRCGGR
jgi:hypothetical protein